MYVYMPSFVLLLQHGLLMNIHLTSFILLFEHSLQINIYCCIICCLNFFQLIKCFFAIFCLKYGLVKAIFYGMMQCSERQKCHFRASNFKNFPGGMPPDPPSYAGPRILLQSDFTLDPPMKTLSIVSNYCP